MSKKRWLSIIVCIIGLALAVSACTANPQSTPTLPPPANTPAAAAATSAPATPTTALAAASATPTLAASTPTAQATQSGKLDLVNSFGYKDSSGYYHVVGLIHNGTAQAQSSIELTLVLKNTAGKTMLQDKDNKPVESVKFNPALDTLAAGEDSPFDYSVNSTDLGEAAPNGFKVTITGQQATQITRAKVTVQNVNMTLGDSGALYITGEIVNLDSTPAQIRSYAAAAKDDKGNVVSATDSGSLTLTLAPAGDPAKNDRTPFNFLLDSPGPVATVPAIYLDAAPPDKFTAPNVKVEVSNTFFDQNKDYHIVGTMTNNDKTALTVRLVAGVYTKDNTPLDADILDSTFDLASGQSVPFDFESFGIVGSMPDKAAALDHYSVQVDPYWTFPATNTTVMLQSAGDKKDDKGNGEWDFSGNITNSSGKELTNEILVIGIYDSQNKLVGMNWTDVSAKGSTFALNEKDPYNVNVFLDPAADASGYTFKTFVQGIVK